MTRGRKPSTIRKVEWKSYIPESLAAEVDLILLDPVTQRPQHGARSELVTNLLQAWVETQRRNFQEQSA